MINEEKWINSIPNTNTQFNKETNQISHNKSVNTVIKKNSFSSVKKYTIVSVLFVVGLIFVSAVKNETRNLQKEINDLQTSVGQINFNLNQAILDYEVITSPESISRLAKEYLSTELEFYKQSQIKYLTNETEGLVKTTKIRKDKKIKKNLKHEVKNTIYKTKAELENLKEISLNPKLIPSEIKKKVAKEIKEKQSGLKDLYNSPKDLITLERAQRWGVVQIVKVFLGIPVVPGK